MPRTPTIRRGREARLLRSRPSGSSSSGAAGELAVRSSRRISGAEIVGEEPDEADETHRQEIRKRIGALPAGTEMCWLSAYSLDKDPKGLNVRAEPSAKAAILGQLRPPMKDPDIGETLAQELSIIGYRDGWFLIDTRIEAEDAGDTPAARPGRKRWFEGRGWISARMAGARTAYSGLGEHKLFAAPSVHAHWTVGRGKERQPDDGATALSAASMPARLIGRSSTARAASAAGVAACARTSSRPVRDETALRHGHPRHRPRMPHCRSSGHVMKQRNNLKATLAAALALAATGALAQPAANQYCVGTPVFGEENANIRLMQVVTKKQRLPFYQNRSDKMRHCPAEVDSCQLKSFVVPGDLLLVTPGANGFACASYISPNVRRVKGQFRETNGFIPQAELSEVKLPSAAAADWRGTWSRSAEAEIRIEPDAGGKLKITGDATFGATDPDRVKRGAINLGELEGLVAVPRSNMIALGEGYDGSKPFGDDRSECRAKLRLFSPYLVVEDNGGCGGMNVSFTGLYVRLKEPPRR